MSDTRPLLHSAHQAPPDSIENDRVKEDDNHEALRQPPELGKMRQAGSGTVSNDQQLISQGTAFIQIHKMQCSLFLHNKWCTPVVTNHLWEVSFENPVQEGAAGHWVSLQREKDQIH